MSDRKPGKSIAMMKRNGLYVGVAVVGLILLPADAPSVAGDAAVQSTSVMVPMRDGARLKTTIYHNGTLDAARPALLLRTPYNQASFDSQGRHFAEAGYVAVTQDCRGRFGSDGRFRFYWGEGEDGFDTVTWIRRQRWSDGRVGLWGASYMGSSQWLTAAERTPLAVAAPAASALNFYYNLYLGGAYMLPHAKTGFCIDLFGPPTDLGSSPHWPEWYLHLPLTDWDKHLGRDVPWQMSMIRHYRPDGFWRGADASGEISHMDFPAQHIVGYYDFMCRETVRAFEAMRERSASEFARSNQQLILGPWGHGTGHRQAGEIDFGPEAQLDIVAENTRWFDRFLRTEPEQRDAFPKVRFFSMGENRWYESDDWPPASARDESWYLRSSGHANTRNGDGRLERTPPSADESGDAFRSDPADPVPCWPAKGTMYQEVWGPVDQAGCQDREDVLVYRSQPLDQPLRIAGRPHMELWVAADAPDADWVVKLIDEHPSGFAHPLATGILRGSARESELHRRPLEPGAHYRIVVDLGHTAARIDAGHRLSVQIAGSSFPHFDRNTHTAEGPFSAKTRVAVEHVFHDSREPSRLVLPAVRPAELSR